MVEFQLIKGNKLILWKESLNFDGQQFDQIEYQQNEPSLLTSTHWTKKTDI